MGDLNGFKVVTLGEGAVGKTSLIMRYVYEVFSATQQTTIGSSFVEREVSVGASSYKLRIWDTAGQERFDALTGFYARGARAVVVCFDLTDRESFERLQTRWIKKVEDDVRAGTCHLCIVGTKADIVKGAPSARAVTPQECEGTLAELRQLAAPHPVDYFEASSKDGVGVGEIFETIARRFHEQEGGAAAAGSEATLRVGGATPKKAGGCC